MSYALSVHWWTSVYTFSITQQHCMNAAKARSTTCQKWSRILKHAYGTMSSPSLNQSWDWTRSEEHTSELQSRFDLVCRLLLEKKNKCYHRFIRCIRTDDNKQ